MFATQAARARRWSDKNYHFGPFTYSSDGSSGGRRIGIILDSGDSGDGDRNARCSIRLHLFGRTFFCELPPIIKPFGEKWDQHSREYGFLWVDGAVHYYYGPQTYDSVSTRSGLWNVPWLQKRHVRQSLYGLKGELMWQWFDRRDGRRSFDAYYWAKGALPKVEFEIEDYDGKRIKAATHIEEREWRHGEGWFKWLSLFVPRRIHRSLDIEFAAEVGTEKGSWKGGLIGTSIEMLPDELHEAAFRRYCALEHRGKHGSYRIKLVEPQ